MTITKRAGSVLFTAAAAAAVIGLSAGSALAATTLTVKVSGGGNYKATATKTVLSDKGVNVTCTSTKLKAASTASGKITNGTHKGVPPVKVGTAAKLAFNNCRSITGAVKTTITKLPYAVSVDSQTNGKGQTDGIISGVTVSVSTTGCSFKVTGSAPGFYTNKTHTLTMTPKLPIKPRKSARLTVSGVRGCSGLVNNNDHPTFTSTYKLSTKTVIKSS
jgi:hypothetical protein